MRPISPAGLDFSSTTRVGGFGEAQYVMPTTLLGKRIAALAGRLTVGQRLLPVTRRGRPARRCRARDRGADPRMTRRLNPASGAARLDEEVQPVAVRVYSRRGSAHVGGRQGLVWMAALELGSPRRSGLVALQETSAHNIAAAHRSFDGCRERSALLVDTRKLLLLTVIHGRYWTILHTSQIVCSFLGRACLPEHSGSLSSPTLRAADVHARQRRQPSTRGSEVSLAASSTISLSSVKSASARFRCPVLGVEIASSDRAPGSRCRSRRTPASTHCMSAR